MATAHSSRVPADSAGASGIRFVDVAVGGGRLSSLAAAQNLARAGKSVIVLEASDRPGGRVQNGVVGGTVCELGGEWVSSVQPHIQAMVAEFDIQTFEFNTAGKCWHSSAWRRRDR
jgi:monoamine oxidase